MQLPTTQVSSDLEKLEAEKLIAETDQLKSEAAKNKADNFRGWFVTVAIIAGVGVSVWEVRNTLKETASREKQATVESELRSQEIKQATVESVLRSQEIFMNGVVDRLSGIQTINYDWARVKGNDKPQWVESTKEIYSSATQASAYVASARLACDFKELREPVIEALDYQVWNSQGTDKYAIEALKIIDTKCAGKNELTKQIYPDFFRDNVIQVDKGDQTDKGDAMPD